MRRYLSFIICALSFSAVLLSSCSNIAEDERLIYVEPAVDPADEPEPTDSAYDAPVKVVPRSVLIEDHTGQKCPNCPEASKLIHDFQQVYGARVVPVAIHSDAQGIMEPEGLGTQLGNTYYRHWNVKFKPAGLISRTDGGLGVVMDKTVWTDALQYMLTLDTSLDIRVKAEQKSDNAADISVKVICTREEAAVSGKLQVWLTEDHIVAQQDSMGVHLANYVHNHVLRAAVNGEWGEDVSVSGQAAQQELHYTATLSPAWKAENLSVVAFVYNYQGVEQAVSKPLALPEKD